MRGFRRGAQMGMGGRRGMGRGFAAMGREGGFAGRGFGRMAMQQGERDQRGFGMLDGHGQGVGLGRNRNQNECQGNGVGFGRGQGRGKGYNRVENRKKEDI